MKIKHSDTADVNATSLQGYIDASYADLRTAFGTPNKGDGYKVDAEWCLTFPCGTVATIYNYKDGKNYNGPSGTPKTKIRDWHIGGRGESAVRLVVQAFKEQTV